MTAATACEPTLKHTELHDWHVERGAKCCPFGGWHMPLQYTRVHTEHAAVREAAGLFDVSHMGVVSFNGPNPTAVVNALETLFPQHLGALTPGQAAYTQLLNPSGGIIDDLIVYQRPSDIPIGFNNIGPWLMVCNASNTIADIAWCQEQLPSNITITYHTELSLFALQGPQFKTILEKLGITQLPERFQLGFTTISTHGKTASIGISRTGYTGEDGVELIVPNEFADILWQALLHEGDADGLLPIGLAARDTLRLEAAYPLHGQEMSPTISPLEAGLGWSLRMDKPIDFIGKDALVQQKQAGIPRQCICVQLEDKAIPRTHTPVLNNDGAPIGEVTSGTLSPTLGHPIAMALVDKDKAPALGQTCLLEIRGKQLAATRVKRPFYTGLQ